MDKYRSEDAEKLTPSESLFLLTFGKWFLRVGGTVIFVLFLLLTGLLGRLSFGPIDLGFLRPEIEQAIQDADTGLDIEFTDIKMVWERWLRPYEIVVKDIRITDSYEKEDILSIDEVGLSLWIEKLISGRFEIRNLFIYSPKLILNRRPDSGFILKFSDDGNSKDISFDELSAFLILGRGEKSLGSLAFLNKIAISDADVTLHDEIAGEVWKLPRSNFTLNRYPDGFRLRTSLMASKDKLFARSLDLELKHLLNSSRLDLILNFKKANFAELIQSNKPLLEDDQNEETQIEKVLELLYGFDFPIQGRIHLAIVPATGQIIEGEVLLQTGAGTVTFADSKIPLNEISIHADIDYSQINVDRLHAQLAKSKFTAKAKHDANGGPLLIQKWFEAGTSMAVSLKAANINMDSLNTLWPKSLASAAREWITQEIKGGSIPQLEAKFEGHVDDASKFSLEKLEGAFPIESLQLNYLDGLPHVLDLSGSAKFNQTGFQIEVTSGRVQGVELIEGTVAITDLDTDDEKLELNLDMEGSLGNVLGILDHEPLGYASMAKLDPAKTTGEGTIKLKMAFPLLTDLKFDDITLDCTATFHDVATSIDFEHSSLKVADGKVKLHVDEKHLFADGTAVINDLKSKLEGLVYFTSPKPKPWDVQIVVDTVMNEKDLKALGYDYTEYIKGNATSKLIFESYSNDKSKLGINLGLKNMLIEVPHIGWLKPLGEKASLAFVIDIGKNGFQKVEDISLHSEYLTTKGTAKFDSKQELSSLYLTSIQAPHFSADVSVVFAKDGGYDLHFQGKEVNAEPLMKYLDIEKELPEVGNPFRLAVSSDVEVLRMKEGAEFRDVNAALEVIIEPTDVVWKRVKLNAAAGNGLSQNGRMGSFDGGISFDLEPDENGGQTLEIYANDAGQLFKNLDIYDLLLGGQMSVQATRSQETKPFVGKFIIDNFDAEKIPLAGLLASALSPMGLVNLFSGDGKLTISSFNCDFTFSEDEVTFKNGVGKSIGLGFTTAGSIDRTNRVFDIKGNIIPAYVLNSILDNIPIVGALLSGGEGEGLFAIAYTVDGSIDNPQVSVNPLTALAPGFIRNLFEDL